MVRRGSQVDGVTTGTVCILIKAPLPPQSRILVARWSGSHAYHTIHNKKFQPWILLHWITHLLCFAVETCQNLRVQACKARTHMTLSRPIVPVSRATCMLDSTCQILSSTLNVFWHVTPVISYAIHDTKAHTVQHPSTYDCTPLENPCFDCPVQA